MSDLISMATVIQSSKCVFSISDGSVWLLDKKLDFSWIDLFDLKRSPMSIKLSALAFSRLPEREKSFFWFFFFFLSSLQVKSMNSTPEQSPLPVLSSTCARARQRRTKRCGQSSRSSRPGVPMVPQRSPTRKAPPPGPAPYRPLNLRHTRPLYLSSLHSQRASTPLISVQLQAKTNIARRRCLLRAWRWNEAAWKERMRTTCTYTLITFCRQRGDSARLASTLSFPLVSSRRG